MKTRSFIAINLPQELKIKIGEDLKKIKSRIKGEIKWVETNNFHLTLHFLGYLDDRQLEKIKQILFEITPNVAKTKIKISGFGVFPNLSQPRVLFLQGTEEKNVLKNLQKQIGLKLTQSNFKVDSRPWQMHFTFGRAKNKIILPKNFLKSGQKYEFEVKSIDLMKSDLKITGPVYTILNSYLLQ